MRAVLFMLAADGRVTADPIDGPGCLDEAMALRESVRDDWPGAIFAVGSDDEAAEDRKDRMMERLGLRGETA